MVSVELVIRFSPTKTWSFPVREIEGLGPTLHRFSGLCELARDALVFHANFKEMVDDDTPFLLQWKDKANIDAMCTTKTCTLNCATKMKREPQVVNNFQHALVLKSERLETVFAYICATWNVKRDDATFCCQSERVFGDDTPASLNLLGSSMIWLFLRPVDIHFRVGDHTGLLLFTVDCDARLGHLLKEFSELRKVERENIEFRYKEDIVADDSTPEKLSMNRSVIVHYTLKQNGPSRVTKRKDKEEETLVPISNLKVRRES